MTFATSWDSWLARARRRRPAMPPPQVLVASDRTGLEYRHGDQDLRFHTASIGKLFTSTLVLQLVAEGRLTSDARLTALLPATDTAGLFDHDGADHAPRVTLEHLLTHTSGVADYFEGPVTGTRPFVERVLTDRDHLWTPAELLDFTRDHQRPVGAPGARFSYSDTGYLLLGRVIEEVTGERFGTALHARIFEPTGMADSCLAFHTLPGGAASGPDPAADLELAPLWLGKDEVSRARSLSCDWAGGGVVTTLDDLLQFQRALHAGALIPADTVAWMARPRNRFRPGIHYGAGMMSLRFPEFFPLLRGLGTPVGHIGVTATHLFHHPQPDAHVVLNFHGSGQMRRSFQFHIAVARGLARGA